MSLLTKSAPKSAEQPRPLPKLADNAKLASETAALADLEKRLAEASAELEAARTNDQFQKLASDQAGLDEAIGQATRREQHAQRKIQVLQEQVAAQKVALLKARTEAIASLAAAAMPEHRRRLKAVADSMAAVLTSWRAFQEYRYDVVVSLEGAAEALPSFGLDPRFVTRLEDLVDNWLPLLADHIQGRPTGAKG